MKKMYDVSILIVVIVVAVAATAGYFSHKFMGEKDNPVEENMEDVIENMTGIDVDLTPDESTGGLLNPSDSK